VPGMAGNRVPNSDLKWETVTQSDIGIDMGLFENRVSLTVDYFSKRYGDMITQRLIPIYAGIVSETYYENPITQPVNSATVTNKGFEFTMNYRKSAGSFTYNLGVNLTTFQNKVIKLADEIVGGNTGNTPQGNLTRTAQGRSVGEFYGWLTDGIFQNQAEVNQANALGDPGVPFQSSGTAPGDIRFKDVNGDHVVDDKDRTYLGSPIPDFTYGFQANVGYHRFDLSLFFQGVHGNKIANVNRFITESSSGSENKSTDMLQRWTDTHSSNTYPRAVNTEAREALEKGTWGRQFKHRLLLPQLGRKRRRIHVLHVRTSVEGKLGRHARRLPDDHVLGLHPERRIRDRSSSGKRRRKSLV